MLFFLPSFPAQSLSGQTYLDNVSSIFSSRPNEAHEIKRKDDAYKHQHGIAFFQLGKWWGPNRIGFYIEGAKKRGVVAPTLRDMDRDLVTNLKKESNIIKMSWGRG